MTANIKPPGLSLWKMYLVIGAIGFSVACMLGYSFYKGDRMSSRYAPLVDAAMEIKLQATTAHLWFEEIISGDSNENIEVVWERLKEADWYTHAMLEGGENAEGKFRPLKDIEMRRIINAVHNELNEFIEITRLRLNAVSTSGPGSVIDQQYDAKFDKFITKADLVETRLQQIMHHDLRRFRQTQIVLIIAGMLSSFLIALAFRRFEHTRIKNYQKLSETNLKLEQEAAARKRAENEMARYRDHLEDLIGEKTIELTETNERLLKENAERKETEIALKQENLYVQALQQVATAANEAKTLDEAMMICLKTVRKITGWPIGHILEPAKDAANALVSSGLWDIKDEERFKIFRNISKDIKFSPGEGLPGRVLASGRPDWIMDVNKDSNFPRAKMGKDIGVKTGLAFPVLIGDEVAAVMEFFSDKEERPYKRLLDVMSHIGTQVGRIIERDRAQEELRKLSQAVVQSPAAVIITDTKGDIEYVNPKFTKLTGYEMSKTLGKNPRILKSGETTDEMYKQLWDTITGGGTWIGEFHNKKKDGEHFWEIATISPLKDRNGVTTHFLAVKEDITERKKAEEDLKRSNEQLIHSDKLSALGKLTGSIAHEFNNPLFGMTNILEQIRDDAPLDEEDRDLLCLAIKECERMAGLVRKLRDFYKPSTAVPKFVNLHETIDDVVLLMNKKLSQRKITLKRQYEPGLPKILIVEDKLKQVILNLLQNAEAAITGDQGMVEVVTESTYPGIRIKISDNGAGISPENMENIFEPFFTTKEGSKGTGLGLSVCYGIIKDFGGDIRVISKPKRGASFIIDLPFERRT